jgi:hypothetical protein
VMLNPPNPLTESNPTAALNLLGTGNPKVPPYPPDPFNPRGAATPQSSGLTGIPFYQTLGVVPAAAERKSVFLIMSFEGEGMSEVLATVKDECDTLGLKATTVRDVVGSDFVMKKIAELIEKAWLIVCDLTYERPNVYYELGYAHGVGNTGSNILLIAREGTTLHFDISPLGVNYYSSMESLRAILRTNLPEMHRDTAAKQALKSKSRAIEPVTLTPGSS